MIIAFLILLGAAQQPDQGTLDEFNLHFRSYNSCQVATVRMGMTTKMTPNQFAEGFAKSCLKEEELFRTTFIEMMVQSGKIAENAAEEVDGNIAKSRSIYVADQKSYIQTGKVPN